MAASKPSKKQDNHGKSKTDDAPIDQTHSAEPTEELNPDLEAELQEAKDQNLRLYAEFENFRRRTAKERLSLMMTAGEKIITNMLPILDDFERALKNLQAGSEEAKGLALIQQKMINNMESQGLKRMESSIGKIFDVESMEAITQIPAPKAADAGKVLDEVEAGYKLGDLIIRYAKVIVAQSAKS